MGNSHCKSVSQIGKECNGNLFKMIWVNSLSPPSSFPSLQLPPTLCPPRPSPRMAHSSPSCSGKFRNGIRSRTLSRRLCVLG